MQADWHIQAVKMPSQIFYDIVGAHLCAVGSQPFRNYMVVFGSIRNCKLW